MKRTSHSPILLMALLFVNGAIFLTSCSTTTAMDKGASVRFPPGSTFTVEYRENDRSEVKQKLEEMLAARGYDVVDKETALKIRDHFANSQGDGVYELRFTYHTIGVVGLTTVGSVFSEFDGFVVDLKTGQIVKTFKHKRGALQVMEKSVTKTLEEMLDQF